MVRRGLFVGRFQPFHKGHLKAVKDILNEVDELIIVVGSPQYSHTIENPFTTGERIVMIKRALTAEGVDSSCYWIIPVPDLHIHMVWVAEVIGYTPKFSTVYTNEPLTRRLFIESRFNIKPVPLHRREEYSSTEIRERILDKKNWKELVPATVAQFIQEIDGPERLRDLAKTDKAPKTGK